jgi:predicted ATPase
VTLALAWGMRCALLVVAGTRGPELRRWLERARTHSVERNIGYWSNVCSMWSAWLQTLDGDVEGGTVLLERHLDAYRSSGGRIGIASFHCLLAAVHLTGGEARAALDVLRAGQQHIDAAGERYFEPEVQWLLARALIAGDAPDPAAAVAAYERAASAAEAQGARLWELRAAIGLGLLERDAGAASRALSRLELLCEWFGPDSGVAEVKKARALLDGEPSAPR